MFSHRVNTLQNDATTALLAITACPQQDIIVTYSTYLGSSNYVYANRVAAALSRMSFGYFFGVVWYEP